MSLGERRAVTYLVHMARHGCFEREKVTGIELSALAAPTHKGTAMPRSIVRTLTEVSLTVTIETYNATVREEVRTVSAPLLEWTDLDAPG